MSVPSSDGALRFVFDDARRHRQTVDNRTGQVLETLSYGADGRLSAITDAYGLQTSFVYSGAQIAITAPYGERTSVTLTDGLASAVHYDNDPNAGASSALNYEVGADRRGLIDSFVDRRGQTHDIALDSYGALLSDSLVEMGSSWTLSGTDTLVDREAAGSDGFDLASDGGLRETTVTSAQGRTRTFRTEDMRRGVHRRTITEPDGSQTVVTTQESGLRTRQVEWTTTEAADGSVVRQEFVSDPQEGSRVPMLREATLTLPSGESARMTHNREVVRVADSHVLAQDYDKVRSRQRVV